MAVDKSYGSGKSRSAANSSARRRVAAGKLTKSKPKTGVTLNKVAKAAGNVVDFAFNGPKEIQGKYSEVGVSPLKVLQAARALVSAGKAAQAGPLTNRLVAKSLGKDAGRLIAQNKGATNSFIRENVIGNAKRVRNISAESVFPRVGGAGTTVRRGRGTVNQKGLEEMIAGGREPSREMLRIPQILKGTNEAYENIAQKAIKAAGLRKTPKKRGR